ncbi:LysR family transcriptional regulator [Denitratisoma oestradiolicum]|uniref:Transcriptional regulator, LysR family n=1 Tax=Denitratisoma oestradiolicum TaxID=311182 RepID=A0A6S6Y0A0_9PROT|nr:LysR family transcriptional regulator [Denitratisoma oestradiolicum]CAB1370683.1 Transcriptional regulator, LysR family [Denitratisoma oestradiolicum]
MNMQDIQLRKVDLNLLVALDALLSVEEVGLAAAKMGITQSAMSHTLRRLRELFGDPLLIKGKGHMIKTPRAEALAAPLRKALLELQQAVRIQSEFIPETSRLRFSIATNDYGDLIMLPPLLSLLSTQAPSIDIRVGHFDPEQSIAPLEAGSIELALCHPLKSATGIHQQTLFEDDFCCVTRQALPGIRSHLDLDTYLTLPHLRIAPRGDQRDPIDRALAQRGRQRRIALSIPNFSSAPMVVARSDLILTAPRRCILAWKNLMPISIYEPPLDLPCFSIAMVWHERFQQNPAHQWLRERLRQIASPSRNTQS